MEYKDIRSQIRSGDILAFSTSGWDTFKHVVSQVIRLVTRSDYNHTGTAWVVGGRVFIIEAVEPLVRIYPLSEKGDFFWVPSSVVWTPDVEEFALSQVGDSYSIWDAIVAPFRDPKSNGSWQCTQLTKAIANKGGMNLQSTPTPANMVRELLELGKTITFVNNP